MMYDYDTIKQVIMKKNVSLKDKMSYIFEVLSMYQITFLDLMQLLPK